MQCACAVLSSVARPALQYFFTLSHKRHDFREEVIEHKMCVLVFPTGLSGIFLILRRIARDMIKNIDWFHVEYHYFCQILMKLEFPR
jgi:hypothetical protein